MYTSTNAHEKRDEKDDQADYNQRCATVVHSFAPEHTNEGVHCDREGSNCYTTLAELLEESLRRAVSANFDLAHIRPSNGQNLSHRLYDIESEKRKLCVNVREGWCEGGGLTHHVNVCRQLEEPPSPKATVPLDIPDDESVYDEYRKER